MKNKDIHEWLLDEGIDPLTTVITEKGEYYLSDILEKHLTEQLRLFAVSGRSEQFVCLCPRNETDNCDRKQPCKECETCPHLSKQMLAAAADGLRKFVWVGWNKHFQNYWVSDPLTTRQLLERKYPSFFNIENDNCLFVMEIFEGDTLIYYSKSSMSSMTVKVENGVFVGEGPFNTHPLEVYFNSEDFVNMKRDVSSCS